MAASTRFTLRIAVLLLLSLASCAPGGSAAPLKIGLLAPFEGRYREIGYDLLYAARLAMQDAGVEQIVLLPIDDGGSAAYAAERAEALSLDPQVMAVMVAGYAATDPDVLDTFGDVPVLVIGHWGVVPEGEGVFVLANPAVVDDLTESARIDVVDAAAIEGEVIGGEVFALKQFPALAGSLEGVQVVSSASPPDAAFTERYLASDAYVPEPGLLVTLAYDAARLTVEAIDPADSRRAAVRDAIANGAYAGLNGLIRFQNGFWSGAPLHIYRYNQEGRLIQE